jgi:hypothetical protein
MGLPGMVLSALSAGAGAITYWCVTAQSSPTIEQHGCRRSTLCVILMVAVAIGFVISMAVFVAPRQAPRCRHARLIERSSTRPVTDR